MAPRKNNGKEAKLSLEWLRENMSYDPVTGVFAWSRPGFGRTVGKPIGSRMWSKGKSYLTMKVDGEVYYAHRLAWFYHYGEWPSDFVDHIDENRANNAISNLRLATAAQNAARRSTTRTIATSRGVFPHGIGFVARIHFKGVRHYLGYFKTAEEAKAAYEAKAKEIHGEFAHPGETINQKGLTGGDRCMICQSSERLRQDRTLTGAPRGILCLSCWGLVQAAGTADNLPEIVRKAVDYLRRYEANGPLLQEATRELTDG